MGSRRGHHAVSAPHRIPLSSATARPLPLPPCQHQQRVRGGITAGRGPSDLRTPSTKHLRLARFRCRSPATSLEDVNMIAGSNQKAETSCPSRH